MRLVLGALLGAASAVAMVRRSPSGHRPPQPRNAGDQRAGPSADRDEPTAHSKPHRATARPSPGEQDAARDERHKRGERIYWGVTGAASIFATGATCFAAWFAWGAYEAALQSVAETRRQANTAQEQLVASTRARLKITSVEKITATKAEGSPVAWFNADATYKNFGQNPAQNIFLSLHVFVVGAGPSPTKTCDRDKARAGRFSFEIVFPQSDEGGSGYGAQVPLDELEAQAAAVRAIQPDITAYLGIIGCLTYKSANSDAVHVTGFDGTLHLADADPPANDRGYTLAYDVIVEGDGPVKVGLKLNTEGAWAD